MVERYIVAYRNLPYDGIQNCELISKPEEGYYIVKPHVMPGLFGFPSLHINHFSATIKSKQFLIITYTEEEVTSQHYLKIVEAVKELLVRKKIITRKDLT